MLPTILLLLLAQDPRQIFSGRYVNVDYGFSVKIPAGLVGEGNVLSAPNHGFTITPSPQATIWVDASYDPVDALPHLTHVNAHLGTLAAYSKQWRDPKDGGQTLHQSVVAIGYDRGTRIIYSITVDAPIPRQREAVNIFREVVKTFHTVPINP